MDNIHKCCRVVTTIGFISLALSVSLTYQIATKNSNAYNVSSLLDKLLLQGYDHRLRPDFGGPPTIVDVNMNIRSMGPVDEKDMTYQMDCYFRQSWTDKRLEFKGGAGSPKILQVSINILNRIWKPDTHFVNGMRSYLHVTTTPNKLLRIDQSGRLLYSMRLTIKASCPMHLENFPMDVQSCPLHFGSHGYPMRDMIYGWTYSPESSIKIAADMTLSQFDLTGYPHHNGTTVHPSMGTYSKMSVSFELRRHMGYFMINVYVPCSLLVVLSWVAFWINREATADRISLGVTTVLTMCFMNIDIRRDVPKVSYSTALDYFVGACFTFVLATIIQFAGVHFFTKHGSGEIQHDSDSEEEDTLDGHTVRSHIYSPNIYHHSPNTISSGKLNGDISPALLDRTRYRVRKEMCCRMFWKCLLGSSTYRIRRKRMSKNKSFNSVSKIDKVSRIIFPFTFISFNIFYWTVYLRSGMVM